MSDAMSDIAQDRRISQAYCNVKILEEKFFEKLSKEKAIELIKSLKNYAYMRGGYWGAPNTILAKEKISLFAEFIEGKTSVEEIKKYVQPSDGKIFYTAVGGHGHLMGDVEDIILQALKTKYDIKPHAFKLIIERDGKILPEKIDCRECIEGGLCVLGQNCNCYNKKEYDKRMRRVNKAEKYLAK